MPSTIPPLVENKIKEMGFTLFGATRLKKPLSIDIYRTWLNEDLHGEMHYLKEHLPIKEKPFLQWPKMKSAIVVAQDYLPHPYHQEDPLPYLRKASYARGRDYHFWLKEKLLVLAEAMKGMYIGHEFLCYTDTGPILERDLAHRAGLGWVGKNGCLLNRIEGSLFFIGEILTTLELSGPPALPSDHCGTCTRCLDVCPTGALRGDGTMDARKCISYLNIEAKSVPPKSLRQPMADWFFGCDLCQTVCPWNLKKFGHTLKYETTLLDHRMGQNELIRDLKWILESSNKKLQRELSGSPLLRAGGRGLKRNALIVAANRQLTELRPIIQSFLNHPTLGELAHWSLEQMNLEKPSL